MTFPKVEKGCHIHSQSKTTEEGTSPSLAMKIIYMASYTQALSHKRKRAQSGGGGHSGALGKGKKQKQVLHNYGRPHGEEEEMDRGCHQTSFSVSEGVVGGQGQERDKPPGSRPKF